MARRFEGIWGSAPRVGLVWTLAVLALTEVAQHLLPMPPPTSTVLLLLGLVAVAYAALREGLASGFMAAGLLGAYTLHFLGPHGVLLSTSAQSLQGGLIMFTIGLVMAAPMAIIRQREETLRGDLERKAHDLARRNEELSESNAALEAFGYVVSHDLKEPVRAIENYLDAVREEYGTEEGARCLARAQDANRRLARMLQGLLDYSRASSATPFVRPVALARVIEGDTCRAQYETAMRERSARLVLSPMLPEVMGDEVILSQLFGNLILNAIRHNARAEPRVEVTTLPAEPGRVHVVVADDGPGFPPEVAARIQQLRGSRPTTVKGGFGLVISHRAAQRLGGRLWVENAPEGGRVHVELPAPAPPEEKPSVVSRLRRDMPGSNPLQG